MDTTRVTVTRAVKNFSDIINRITYRGERFILLKGKKPVAEMGPVVTGRKVTELPEIMKKLPSLSEKERESFSRDLKTIREEGSLETLRDPWAS